MTDMQQAMETLGKVYQMMEDQESKEIFMNRLAFDISGKGGNPYILAIMSSYFLHQYPKGFRASGFLDSLKEISAKVPENRKFVLYGAGSDGKDLFQYFAKSDPRFIGFCSETKAKQENGYLGYPVISPEELLARRDLYVVIATNEARDELLNILENGNYPPELIIDGPVYYCAKFGEAEQYFGPSFLQFSDEEVFIDAGCYDFRSSLALARHCKHVKKVYAFEPDPKNYEKCLKVAGARSRKRIKNVQILPYGAWSEKTTLAFSAQGEGYSSFCDQEAAESVLLPVTSIDSVVDPNDRVTTIKMDIEGSELEALKGAKETILRDKPKLAICIYHKPEDLWEIPLYIKELVPEYHLYIRHYSVGPAETVLYAVMP